MLNAEYETVDALSLCVFVEDERAEGGPLFYTLYEPFSLIN